MIRGTVQVAAILMLASCSGEPTKPEDALGSTNSAAPVSAKKSTAGSGPFGLTFGAAIDQVDGAKLLEGQRSVYELNDPPKPHPDFESVVLVAHDAEGICTIRGLGPNLEQDGSGIRVRSKIDELADALTTKYGPPEKQDICSGSEVACENQFWMMTLLQNERGYGFSWEKPNEAMRQNGIGNIYLAAKAGDINTSYVLLEFNSAKRAECESAAKAVAAEAL